MSAFQAVGSGVPRRGRRAPVAAAAEILEAGEKIAILVGQGARGAAAEVAEIADVLGAGVAKALLGKDVG
jgi:pyruvate dehydrogenase (quinone)